MKKLKYYLGIWWLMSKNSFVSILYSKLSLFIFLTGKLLRFFFFFAFLFFLLKGTNTLAGYNLQQATFFFLTFNLIDVVSQFFFRETYRFRPLIISGDFDLILVKPVNALFRSLMGRADIIDLITIPPLILAIIYSGRTLDPQWYASLYYLLMVFNGLLIATAFHIAVLALGIITFEVDHMIMIYRDLTALGRLPVDIYREPIRSIITYLIPIGLMITIPAKAFMGLVTFKGILLSFVLGLTMIVIAIRFWRYALKRYTSASS